TGASLRMEVEMNRADLRAIGVGSAAAIAVSLITIIVYEGHVRVTQAGQTVQVAAGSSLELRPTPAPAPTPDDQLAVGGGAPDRTQALAARIAELEARLAEAEQRPADATVKRPPATEEGAPCDEVSCVLTNYAGACCAPFKKAQK